MQRSQRIALVLVLLLGVALRLVGWERGQAQFAPTGEAAFYSFHPDEETLLRAALELHSPLQPPLTAYGLLPIYMAKAALALAAVDFSEPSRLYRVARSLALLCSVLSLWLVWVLAQRRMDGWAALLALFFVACAPLAIQLAHFYTVDGIFVLVLLLFFAVWESGLAAHWRYVLAGLLVGVAGAVRFNGLALGLALLAGHCATIGSWRQFPARLKDPKLWLAALAALVALLVLQPYLLTNPALLLQAQTTDDFLYSLRLAQGDILRPWSLADRHTAPYLHYWTDLWPAAVGWPLTLLMGAGVAWVVWRRSRAEAAALSWCALCFLSIGPLHTKHVRYLLPLLPFLALFAAYCTEWMWRRSRLLGVLVAGVPACYVALYGIAFAGIYAKEDSRIEAGRWIATHIEKGVQVGVEGGAFTMQKMIPQPDYTQQTLSMNVLFGARGYLGCGAAAEFLWSRARDMDYIAVLDVNRQRQFVAASDLYPVAASFYEKLWAGQLGFREVQRFKVYPQLGKLRFVDDDAEPSFLAYDHPAVHIFARQEQANASWAAWRSVLTADANCADAALQTAVDAYERGDYPHALQAAEEMLRAHPDFVTGHFVLASIYNRLGEAAREKEQVRLYAAGYRNENAYLVPWAAASALWSVGASDMVYAVLQHGVQLTDWLGEGDRLRMGASYELLASWCQEHEMMERAAAIYALAADVYGESAGSELSATVYARLGMLHYAQGQLEASTRAYESALALDENQDVARINYGWNLYQLSRLQEAATQFERVLEVRESSVAAFNLGLVYLEMGRDEEAAAIYARAVEKYGAEVARRLGSVGELRAAVERLGRGRHILMRHWPQEP